MIEKLESRYLKVVLFVNNMTNDRLV